MERSAMEGRSRTQGWGRVLHGNRVVWTLAAVSAIALLLGVVIGRVALATNSDDLSGVPPAPGLITVPVESRVISNEVVARGDAAYADGVELTVGAAGLAGPPVVTGRVPAPGDLLRSGAVALEVSGRPLIVLPGAIPAYRTMRAGMSGPDVAQLKRALASLRIDPGDPDSDDFDADTARAVDTLYVKVGYPAPTLEGSTAAVATAREALRQAQLGVLSARRDLKVARAGSSKSDKLEQDGLVRAAERALRAAQAGGDPAVIAEATDALILARARREEVRAPHDTTVERAALGAAEAAVVSARKALTEVELNALPFAPVSEIAFVPKLPSRVDAVTARRGVELAGTALTVSGATLVVTATLSARDAALITVGGKAQITLPDGTPVAASVASIGSDGTTGSDGQADRSTTISGTAGDGGTATAGSGDSSGSQDASGSGTGETAVTLTPRAKPEQLTALKGQNVRVSLPVASTDGAVLAVPVAALTAGPGGESRVEVPTGADTATELVEVTPGLAAGGYVEITPVSRRLVAGDKVVVGR